MSGQVATASGRTIAEIAAWADQYADGRTEDEHIASAVISVAVVQVVGPTEKAYDPTRCLVGDLMRGRLTGVDTATWSIENFDPSQTARVEHALRLRTISDVIAATHHARLEPLARCARELRAYADIYSPRFVCCGDCGVHPAGSVDRYDGDGEPARRYLFPRPVSP